MGHLGREWDIFRRKTRKIPRFRDRENGASGNKIFMLEVDSQAIASWRPRRLGGSTFPVCFFARMRLPCVSWELPEVWHVQRRGGRILLLLE